MSPFRNPAVEKVFASYPTLARRKLLAVRQLIIDTAAITPDAGELEETLKWGEPAYLTSKTKSGSTVRIAYKPAKPLHYAMYFNCQTTLVDTFRTVFPNDLKFECNRAIVFAVADKIPTKELTWCITAALTYHRKR